MKRMLVRSIPLLAVAIGVAMLIAGVGSTMQAINSQGAVRPERLPDLDQEVPADLEVKVVATAAGTSYRLGFSSAVRNIGAGPLVVSGSRPDTSTPFMRVDQLIDRGGGPPARVRNVGLMKYTISPDHRHWHYLQFDRYQLQSYELRPAQGTGKIVKDQKTGFCLGDRYRATKKTYPAAAPRPVFTSRCGLGNPSLLRMREGISVGWGDDYHAFLEGQDLPLDGLRNGRYLLVHRANADRQLRELSYANNAASVLLDLHWAGGKPYLQVIAACPDSDHCAPPAHATGTRLTAPE
jgi:hypothetical protein